eukprot:9055324-Heterocapsa_arctica.AAC.1
MLNQIISLDWDRRQVNASDFSEAMARRSLLNNARPTLQESAAWMTRHGVINDDIRGQFLWNQALEN